MMGTAALLEALQAFTPDRHADFYAALFGAGGALTQALLAELFIRARGGRKLGSKSKIRKLRKRHQGCRPYSTSTNPPYRPE